MEAGAGSRAGAGEGLQKILTKSKFLSCTHMHAPTHTHMHTPTHTPTHTYTHMYTHVHTYTHMYTRDNN
jgi:hypothetical protein